MNEISLFAPEKLVIAILISRSDLKPPLLRVLSSSFGSIDFQSRELNFHFTHYYDQEMGDSLSRLFVSFAKLVAPETLADIKMQTGRIEDRFRDEGNRTVHLDPGLLSLSRFILATTKDSSHRIPLRTGIYAEVTLMFERGAFRPVEWTYPDYRSEQYLQILDSIRLLYRNQLQGRPKAKRLG